MDTIIEKMRTGGTILLVILTVIILLPGIYIVYLSKTAKDKDGKKVDKKGLLYFGISLILFWVIIIGLMFGPQLFKKLN